MSFLRFFQKTAGLVAQRIFVSPAARTPFIAKDSWRHEIFSDVRKAG
jgi:hypothetical protein